MHSVDEKLVSQTLGGDRDAFGVLVHKYQEMVYTYAFQKVRNEADAQDIMQEIFLQAYRRLYQLRHPHLFRSWLYTIMSNECKRWLVRVTKKRRREIVLEEATDEALRIEPSHAVPVEGWQVNLEQAISALPDESWIAVSMFYMGDCSLKEISEFLGVSVNTVKSKLHRARQQLGGALSEHYGRLLKSHKLRGGFLMQFMEQIRHAPAPTMGLAWSSASVGKATFALIAALCVLIGLIGVRNDFPTKLSTSQIGLTSSVVNRLPIEVTLLRAVPYSTRSPISGIPVPTGERPLDTSSRVSIEQSGRSIGREMTSAANGTKTPNPQFSAAMVENAPEKLAYSGRVVDSDGEPVADAEILYSVKYSVESAPPKSVAQTTADGTFNFEFPRPNLKEWNRVDIVAVHPDHAFGWRNLSPKSATNVEIQLATPAVISGKIMDEAGEPIQAGEAWIGLLSSSDQLLGVHASYLLEDVIPIPHAKSDPNGEFVIHGLPKGGKTILFVQGLGYAKERSEGVRVGTEGLRFRLKREARIEGRLSYTDTGEPVQDATVALQGIYPTEVWEHVGVDVDGKYFLKNLAPGTYSLFLFEGPDGWTAAANERLEIVEGQTVSNIDLTLVRGGFITGRVTDADTGEPIANQHISFYDAARPESQQAANHGAKTDETGTYRFRAAPGKALVYTGAEHGYQDVGQMRRYVDVVEGATVAVDFEFTKGVELNGRVLTEAGEPVSGARVTDIAGKYAYFHEHGLSDENGGFTVRGLRTGQKLILKAEHSDLGLRGTAEVEVKPRASVDIRIRPYELVKVSGRVVNPKGEPIASVNIYRMPWDPMRNLGMSSIVAVTNGDGRFGEVELVVGDQYEISAVTEGYREARTEEFTVTPGMHQISDLVLQPAGGAYFIEGRVTDTSGKPVSGARLVTSQQSQHWETLTDANGDYRLENLSMVVLYSLDIIHPDYAYHTFEILKTNQRHDLVLVKADGYIAGKVVDADGTPIYRATVAIDPQEDPATGVVYPAVATNGQGEFELKYIKDPTVSIDVGNDNDYGVFENIKVNQDDLVLTLTPTEPIPAPTPEQSARWAYAEELEERFKASVGKPTPELAVEEWLTGTVSSIGNLKGSTIALDFWESGNSDNIQSVRLLNVLHDIYEEKGLVCITIIPPTEEVETVKRHIAEHSLRYSIGLDKSTKVVGANGETFDRYLIGGRGSIVLINAAGEIAGSVYPWDLGDQVQNLFED